MSSGDDPAPRRAREWLRAPCAGAALMLAGAPVGAVVQGTAWWGYAGGIVALVVLVGVATSRLRPPGAAVAQVAALALALTALFTDAGVLRVLPGRAVAHELAALVAEAGTQIRSGTAPVPATPAMLLLVTGAFGLTAIAVHAVAVGARAPAAAGVLLLAVFAVPTALADDLLPAWMLAAAAAGYGLLLLSGAGAHWLRRSPAAVGVVAVALVLALGAGAAATAVGTAGRLDDSAVGPARGGEIGLSPFAALRGQLRRDAPADLFRVSGLPRPVYLRALTLSSYVPNGGWQPQRPGTSTRLTDALPPVTLPGDRVTVTVENAGFRDYWLPLYGEPLGVDGVTRDRWSYDARSGTVFSSRPRREDGWTEQAVLPAPSVAALRAADGAAGTDPEFLATEGIDPRVAAIAAQVTSGASTGFDRAVALTRWFTGPDSAFRYDLATAPGDGDDAMVDFLTRGRRGYCEQFASSMAAMLRTVGVPSRVAVGFTGGRDDGDTRVVSTADAHAWVEAWFPRAGWTAFDPTPLTDGRAVVPPYVGDALAQSTPAAPDTTAPDPTAEQPPPSPQPSSGPSEPATTAPAAPDGGDAARTPPTPSGSVPWTTVLPVLLGLAAVAAVVALGAAPTMVRERVRRRRLAAADAGGPGAATAAWNELLAESTDRGAPSPATDTVRAAAGRMVDDHRLDAGARDALRHVVGMVEESWYGAVDAEPGALTAPVRAVRDGMAAGTPLGWRGRLLPRSLAAALRRRPTARTTTTRGDESGTGAEAVRDDAAAARR